MEVNCKKWAMENIHGFTLSGINKDGEFIEHAWCAQQGKAIKKDIIEQKKKWVKELLEKGTDANQ